jgi:hypothetical protein
MRFSVQVDLLAQGIPFNFPDDGAMRASQAPANLTAGASLRQKSRDQRAFFHVKLTVRHGGGSRSRWVGRTSQTPTVSYFQLVHLGWNSARPEPVTFPSAC